MAARGAAKEVDVEGVAAETTEEHRKRVSKWKNDVAQVVMKHTFWFTLAVSSVSHGPLDHASNWLSAPKAEEPRNMIEFACSKSRVLNKDFERLLTVERWVDALAIARDGQIAVDVAVGIVIHGVLGNASAWHQRFSARLDAFPCRLCCLVVSKPDVVCEERKQANLSLVVTDYSSSVEHHQRRKRQTRKCCKCTNHNKYLVKS